MNLQWRRRLKCIHYYYTYEGTYQKRINKNPLFWMDP